MSDFKYLLNCFFSQIQKTLKPMKLRSKQKHVRKYITSSATLCKCCIVEYLKKSFESFNLHLISFESSIKKKGRVLICHLKQNFVDCWKKLLRSVLLSCSGIFLCEFIYGGTKGTLAILDMLLLLFLLTYLQSIQLLLIKIY